MATRATTATANTTLIERDWLTSWVLPLLALPPAVALAVFGAIHFRDGLARDAAVPVPVYMVAEIPVPKAAYASAAEALSRASIRNGEAALARVEALRNASTSPALLVAPTREALGHVPASPRGWTLLAEMLSGSNKPAAAKALSQALILAPRDYWLAPMRARDAALLWPELDAEGRAMAIAQSRLLWQEPQLRPQLLRLTATSDGVALVTRSFQPDEIRMINRWMARERRRRP